MVSKSGGTFGVVSTVQLTAIMSHRTAKNHSLILKNRDTICVAVNVDITCITCIVADGLYFSLCSPPWNLNFIRSLNRRKIC